MTGLPRQAFAVAATVVVTAAVLGGLYLLGAPGEARERRLDARRVADLRAFASAVDLYWTRRGSLPASPGELARETELRLTTRDPVTARPYEYRVLGDQRYELCAEFARSSAQEPGASDRDFWAHGPGPRCFRLEAEELKH